MRAFCGVRLMILAVLVGLPASASVFGHHSFAAEYDGNNVLSVKGTVTQFEWANPHVHCHTDVTDGNGTATNWDFELGGPGLLVQNGWSKNTLHAGDAVTVKAALARNGSHKGSARTITLPDGRELFASSPADGGPN